MAESICVKDVISLSADPYEVPFSDEERRAIADMFGKHWLNADGFSLESAPLTSVHDVDHYTASAEDVVAEQQEHDILRRAVAMLTERQRAAVMLRFGFTPSGEHTQAEAAEVLGVSQPSLYRLQSRAIANLRKILAAMPDGLELIASRMIEMGKSGRA